MLQFDVATQTDVGRARREARSLAVAQGLRRDDAEAVALAVTELATNLVRYATGGMIVLQPCANRCGLGIQVESRDAGPGIADLGRAMQDGFSTGGGMGSGLPAVRRLMDDFEIASTPQGTRVAARKWAARC